MIEIIVLWALLVFSLLDIKYKAIPSVFLTSLLLVVATVKMENLSQAILIGILALLFFDVNYFKGIADIKSMVIIGFLIPNLEMLWVFIILLLTLGIGYTIFMRHFIKEKGDIPFLPCIFLSYLIYYLWMLM